MQTTDRYASKSLNWPGAELVTTSPSLVWREKYGCETGVVGEQKVWKSPRWVGYEGMGFSKRHGLTQLRDNH